MLSLAVRSALSDDVFKRVDAGAVAEAFRQIGVKVPDAFREFFETYRGPFGSTRTGFELLDLYDSTPAIVSLTEECRSTYEWPNRYLVLTDLLGGSVLVLDAEGDQVFNVDFEGGDESLLNGALPASWSSFATFLDEFFG